MTYQNKEIRKGNTTTTIKFHRNNGLLSINYGNPIKTLVSDTTRDISNAIFQKLIIYIEQTEVTTTTVI
jgi:hypothetical protein